MTEPFLPRAVQEAEFDYGKFGDASDLHVIIFDEIDAICKVRDSCADPSSS